MRRKTKKTPPKTPPSAYAAMRESLGSNKKKLNFRLLHKFNRKSRKDISEPVSPVSVTVDVMNEPPLEEESSTRSPDLVVQLNDPSSPERRLRENIGDKLYMSNDDRDQSNLVDSSLSPSAHRRLFDTSTLIKEVRSEHNGKIIITTESKKDNCSPSHNNEKPKLQQKESPTTTERFIQNTLNLPSFLQSECGSFNIDMDSHSVKGRSEFEREAMNNHDIRRPHRRAKSLSDVGPLINDEFQIPYGHQPMQFADWEAADQSITGQTASSFGIKNIHSSSRFSRREVNSAPDKAKSYDENFWIKKTYSKGSVLSMDSHEDQYIYYRNDSFGDVLSIDDLNEAMMYENDEYGPHISNACTNYVDVGCGSIQDSFISGIRALFSDYEIPTPAGDTRKNDLMIAKTYTQSTISDRESYSSSNIKNLMKETKRRNRKSHRKNSRY